jgi:sulfoxide reductase catalytic subunit YedY
MRRHLVRKAWQVSDSQHTAEAVYRRRGQHRREFLEAVALGAVSSTLGWAVSGCSKPTDAELEQAGRVVPLAEEFAGLYPAPRNERFEYGRPETAKRDAAEFTNFYEFTGPSRSKDTYNHVDRFVTSPWSIEVDGLCAKPRRFDLDDLYRTFSLEERAYRHRCVETWAMCVPWTGFPLRDLLREVEPGATAKYVAFETFHRPDEALFVARSDDYPWPYTEGLTIDEALNELTLVTLGVFGEPLPKQHGAPVRVVVPWKYGFKSIKSIVRITLTDKLPPTFWNTLAPHEYAFEANVEPDVPHPRWSQATEWMLGTGDRYETVKYNGYGDYVAKLYEG